MTMTTSAAVSYRLPQQRNLVTPIPGPKSHELQGRRTMAVAGGVGSTVPVYAADADGGVIVDIDGNVTGIKPVIYMNRDLLEALDALSTNSGASDNKIRLMPEEIAGKEIKGYREMPIRETDALINAEARVV